MRTGTQRWLAALILCWGGAACGEARDPASHGAVAGSSGAASGTGGSALRAGSGGNDSLPAAGTTARPGGAGAPAMMPMADAMVTMPPAPDAGSMPMNDAGAAACGICSAYAEPVRSGAVGFAELSALSGLAASRTQPAIVFAHNDHDRPVVYALDDSGALHARIELEDAPATDIEDIAVGPCGAESCVYLGDVGDNAAARGEYAILRFAEPMVPDSAGTTNLSPDFERFRFTYEDGSHNAEGLMVGPDGTVYVLTKLASGSGGAVAARGPSSVYRLQAPLSATAVAVATKVATLPIPSDDDLAASAAATHPCGLGFLVRTYDRVYEFRTPEGAAFESAFTVAPAVVAMPDEPQSEGIDYRADGRGFISSGEGARAPIYTTACE